MSVVLSNQIEASAKSLEELEQRADHQQAMLYLDLEALMESLIDIHNDLARYVERWQREFDHDGPNGREDDTRHLYDLFVRLDGLFLRTAQLARTVEAWGFNIAPKSLFTTTWRRLKEVVCISPERLSESFAQIRRGQTRTLGELEDELSRRSEH